MLTARFLLVFYLNVVKPKLPFGESCVERIYKVVFLY